MKYALVYDGNGKEQYYGFTEVLDLEQLSQLCQNAIDDGIDLFRIDRKSTRLNSSHTT